MVLKVETVIVVEDEEDEYKIFGKILHICAGICNQTYILVQLMKTLYYDSHRYCHVVELLSEKKLLTLDNEYFKTYTLTDFKSNKFVI